MKNTASVGRQVHYYDREECVNAAAAGRNPEPFAATITRVHKDQDGQPLDVVNLSVLDPEIGHQMKRDVHPGADVEKPEAHRWYWPPYVAPRGATVNRMSLDDSKQQDGGGATAQ